MKFIVSLCVFALMTLSMGAQSTFTNPLLPSGADPFVTQRDGYYVYMQTTGRNLTLWRTRDITDLAHAEKKVVWTPPATGEYAKEIWAPEIHHIEGKWYIYFAADDGRNENHRLYVLENGSANPLEGKWEFKGKLKGAPERWAIDATILEGETNYILWSGWAGKTNGVQHIYIARLKNPWTVEGEAVAISTPTYPWEKVGDLDTGETQIITMPHVDVNEGPETLQHAGKIFLIFSASGCWTNYYELGMAEADAKADLLNPASWKKIDHAVFQGSAEAGVFAPGHNTFFISPDGKQDWILYHANAAANLGCGEKRSPRAQQFTWNSDGTPNFGKPLATTAPLQKPSGTAVR